MAKFEVLLTMKTCGGEEKRYIHPFETLEDARKWFWQEYDSEDWEHVELFDETGERLDGR